MILWSRYYHIPIMLILKVRYREMKQLSYGYTGRKSHSQDAHLVWCRGWALNHFAVVHVDFTSMTFVTVISPYICEVISTTWRLCMLSNCFHKTTVEGEQSKYYLYNTGEGTKAQGACDFSQSHRAHNWKDLISFVFWG